MIDKEQLIDALMSLLIKKGYSETNAFIKANMLYDYLSDEKSHTMTL